MYWPRMVVEITEGVQRCPTCEEFQPAQQKEELMTHPIAKYPVQALVSECFELD